MDKLQVLQRIEFNNGIDYSSKHSQQRESTIQTYTIRYGSRRAG